ncbi:MAG TPA: sulfite exporter TauE/SafE family protein [Solirubrobacterales bacterium]|nr:sulfite exporter TauE/SafE family protein [Solirubrobacterales bacterium]
MLADAALGAGIAFCIAVLTTPVGVSGAVFLVPVQLSVLHTPSPAVTPTNLLYNLVAIPGALFQFHREQRLASPLTRLLILGTLPGVVAGAVIRVELLDRAGAFLLVVAAVLIPLGAWLAIANPPREAVRPDRKRRRQILLLALAVGTVGGIYGIGGGSILGPILVGLGFSVLEVAPAALAATFLTSIAGVIAFALLSIVGSGDVAPNWSLGIGMGIGGLAGAYLGARLQTRLPEQLLRRGLGVLALALGLRYAVLALT